MLIVFSIQLVLLFSPNFIFCDARNKPLLVPLVPSESYTHHESIIDTDPGQFNIYWKVFSTQEIQFEVHVRTLGWVGLGISTNGGMKGSDIAIGWYDASGAHLKVSKYKQAKQKF